MLKNDGIFPQYHDFCLAQLYHPPHNKVHTHIVNGQNVQTRRKGEDRHVSMSNISICPKNFLGQYFHSEQ